jgi:tetratricopeptide (TPR) repeat protein
LDDTWGAALCHEALGMTFGGSPRGLDHYRKATDLFRAVGAGHDLASVLFSMSYRSLIPSGRFDEARAALKEGLDISLRLQLRHGILHARTGLGQLARLEGRADEAGAELEECLGGMRDLGDQRCTVRILTALAQLALERDQQALAARYLGEAVSIASALDPAPFADLVDAVVIEVIERGEAEAAGRWLAAVDRGRSEFGLVRAPPDEARVAEARYRIEFALGPEQARRQAEEGEATTFGEIARELRHRPFGLGSPSV